MRVYHITIVAAACALASTVYICVVGAPAMLVVASAFAAGHLIGLLAARGREV